MARANPLRASTLGENAGRQPKMVAFARAIASSAQMFETQDRSEYLLLIKRPTRSLQHGGTIKGIRFAKGPSTNWAATNDNPGVPLCIFDESIDALTLARSIKAHLAIHGISAADHKLLKRARYDLAMRQPHFAEPEPASRSCRIRVELCHAVTTRGATASISASSKTTSGVFPPNSKQSLFERLRSFFGDLSTSFGAPGVVD